MPTYPSDLTDAEWAVLEPLLPPPNTRGRPSKWPRRVIMDAIFYILGTGGAWRYLPDSFPPWQTIYCHYYKWCRQGLLDRTHHILRRHTRVAAGRDPEPTAGVMDSQSSKTTEQGGPRGFDDAKKINGRKRHLLVGTTGLVDEKQGVQLEVVYPWWRQLKRTTPALAKEWGKGFTVLPRRWVVERTFAWLGKQRRFSKDYERLPETSEALVYLGMTRLMIRRFARAARA